MNGYARMKTVNSGTKTEKIEFYINGYETGPMHVIGYYGKYLIVKEDGHTTYLNRGSGNKYFPAHVYIFEVYNMTEDGTIRVDSICDFDDGRTSYVKEDDVRNTIKRMLERREKERHNLTDSD